MRRQDSIFEVNQAEFSPCRAYRYTLTRIWGFTAPQRLVNFIMLNPSTADEISNDPTVERCERRVRQWGYEGLIVTNIFALRATDPTVMLCHPEPIGPDNDAAIVRASLAAHMIICAWGNDGRHLNRAERVMKLLAGRELHYLKINEATGYPAHPLYLSYSLQPQLLCKGLTT